MLSPFIPHAAQEMWEMIGKTEELINVSWPKAIEEALVVSEIEIAIQINSKVRAKQVIASDLSDEEIKQVVLNNETIIPLIEGKEVKKVIIIKGRLVNVIV